MGRILFSFLFHCFITLASHNYDVEISQEPQCQLDHESDNKKEVLALLEQYKITEAPPSNKTILKLAARTQKEVVDEN